MRFKQVDQRFRQESRPLPENYVNTPGDRASIKEFSADLLQDGNKSSGLVEIGHDDELINLVDVLCEAGENVSQDLAHRVVKKWTEEAVG